MSAMIAQASQFEAMGVTLMGRIQATGAVNITQAAISSIAYTVTRYGSQDDAEACRNGTAVITGGTLNKTSVVFDTLQTSAPWTTDSTGYNFRYDSVAADRPAVSGGGKYWHRYDIVFTPTSGAPYPAVFIVETLPMGP